MITRKSKMIVFTLLSILIHIQIYGQLDPASLAAKDLMQKLLKQLYTIEQIKAMTTSEGTGVVRTAYNNSIQEVNRHYDKAIQLANNEYATSIRMAKNPKDNNYQANRFKIREEKVSKIESARNRDLNRLQQEYDSTIRAFSPFWSKNNFNGKMKYKF